VLLLGMRLPPNYGKRYTDAFAQVYSNWRREKHPAGTVFPRRRGWASEMMQADGMHPAGAQASCWKMSGRR
jgi:acyl-CoA thioesterase-1